jgi:ketosteroid isomerase-like protein
MSPRRRGATLLALGCAGILATAGCGADEASDQDPEETIQAYVDARNDGDAAALCGLYVAEIRDQIPTAGGCEQFVSKRMSETEGTTIEFVDVSEKGGTAIATISSGDEGGTPLPVTIMLAQEDGEWAIAGVDYTSGL